MSSEEQLRLCERAADALQHRAFSPADTAILFGLTAGALLQIIGPGVNPEIARRALDLHMSLGSIMGGRAMTMGSFADVLRARLDALTGGAA